MSPSKELIDAIAGVWKIRPPGPESLNKSPAVIRLFEVCKGDYPGQDIGSGPGWAITTALRSLGMPCELPKEQGDLALPVEEAAQRLDAAFRATSFRRRHIAPLDLADEFPDLDFGSAKVAEVPRASKTGSNPDPYTRKRPASPAGRFLLCAATLRAAPRHTQRRFRKGLDEIEQRSLF